MTWQDRAACKGLTSLFYPPENVDRNNRNHARVLYAEARVVCMTCPVRVDCLDQALADGELSYGMFGGMSPTERRQLVRRRDVGNDNARALWEAMR